MKYHLEFSQYQKIDAFWIRRDENAILRNKIDQGGFSETEATATRNSGNTVPLPKEFKHINLALAI